MKALFKLYTFELDISMKFYKSTSTCHSLKPKATSGTTNYDKTHGKQCYYNALTVRVGPVLQYSKRILLELWNVPVAHHAGNKKRNFGPNFFFLELFTFIKELHVCTFV